MSSTKVNPLGDVIRDLGAQIHSKAPETQAILTKLAVLFSSPQLICTSKRQKTRDFEDKTIKERDLIYQVKSPPFEKISKNAILSVPVPTCFVYLSKD